MKKRVLVIGCGTIVAADLNMALKNNDEFEIWGSSIYKNHGIYVYKNYIDDIPSMNDKNFIKVLNSKIEEYDFKYLIPTHEDMILFLQANKDKINATIISSNYDTSLLCRYKTKTYERMKEYDFVPKVYKKEEVKEYPVFVKKDDDQGARHAHKVENKEELDLYTKEDNMIICEYLPGEEVTVDCFTNKNRELIFCNPREADRMLAGIDVHSRRIPLTDEIKYIANSLNKEINFRGNWFFQIKKDINKKFKLLEISTRLAGAFSLSRGLDVNLPLFALKDFDGQDVNITYNDTNIEADKEFFGKYNIDVKYNEVYIDYETCFKNVDPLLMMYLYQCINKNIEIKLLTQNKAKAMAFFKENKISNELFNQIIELNRTNIKNILKKNSIFVSNDIELKNSIRVNEKKYYCFDSNIVEALIDWRN